MNFDCSEQEQAIDDLTEQILADKSTHARLKELMATDDHVDREAWAALARSGVVGCSLPEEYGGAGLGYLAVAKAIERVGYHASPVPLLPTVVTAAMPIAEFGSDVQKAAWLPAITGGTLLAAAALYEVGSDPTAPMTVATASPDGDGGYVISGTKPMVQGGLEAGVLLVSARLSDDSCGVFLVDPDTDGVTRSRVETTTGHPQALIDFHSTRLGADALLGGGSVDGAEIIDWIVKRATVAMCMMMAGAARASIELAAEYTAQRVQFDRAIATFQAVSNRAGDTYIDTEAIRLTAYQAAWRLDQDLEAGDQIDIAKWWAAEGGFRVVHGAVHVHGGVGVDRDYPLHRYFLLARQLELSMGTGEEHLVTLGRRIAAR